MAKNVLKSSKTQANSTPKKKKVKAKKEGKSPISAGLSLTAFYLFNNIHFVFYIAFLSIIYIGNSHYAIQKIKRIKELQRENKRTSWESNSTEADLMKEIRESKVAEKVHHLGLKELREKPYKITITKLSDKVGSWIIENLGS